MRPLRRVGALATGIAQSGLLRRARKAFLHASHAGWPVPSEAFDTGKDVLRGQVRFLHHFLKRAACSPPAVPAGVSEYPAVEGPVHQSLIH